MEGRGVARYENGQEYTGNFKQGLRDGRGSIVFTNQAVYEGRFREDHMDGQGTIRLERPAKGAEDGEYLLPVLLQTDMKRIHMKAGFGDDAAH